MSDLVVGDTSQLSRYFPEDFVRIPSRGIDFGFVASRHWDNAYLCFAEQRTFRAEDPGSFFDVNCAYTMDVVERMKRHCGRIHYFSTTYLWSACDGPIDLSMPYRYEETPYIRSKEIISRHLAENVPNAVVLYACNFNSVHRKGGFLFYKVFDSIVNRRRITIGDTHFPRELAHPRYVVAEALKCAGHALIGPGYCIDVNGFIRDLYGACGLAYEDFVTEDIRGPGAGVKPHVYFTRREKIDYTREDLLRDTVGELERARG